MQNSITKTRIFLFCVAVAMFFLNNNFSYCQVNAYWEINGNNAGSFPLQARINANSFVGSTDINFPFNLKTTQAQPMNFFTNNTIRAQFTIGNALTNIAGLAGDGLRFFDPTGA